MCRTGRIRHATRYATCLLILAAGGAGLYGMQAPVVAHVLDATGDWRVEGSQNPLVAGTALHAGARVAAVSNRAGDVITIVRDDDMSRQRIACDKSNANPCRNAIVLAEGTPGEPSTLSQLKGMVQATLSVLLNKPPAVTNHYAMTLSRGADAVRELEAVTSFDAARGTMLPAPPADMPAGAYKFSIARADGTSAHTRLTGTLTSEGLWRPIALEAAGLYEISIVNADDEEVADLVLLVTSPADYPGERDRFEAMKNGAAAWTGPAARADEHLFLRAFLSSESHP